MPYLLPKLLSTRVTRKTSTSTTGSRNRKGELTCKNHISIKFGSRTEQSRAPRRLTNETDPVITWRGVTSGCGRLRTTPQVRRSPQTTEIRRTRWQIFAPGSRMRFYDKPRRNLGPEEVYPNGRQGDKHAVAAWFTKVKIICGIC